MLFSRCKQANYEATLLLVLRIKGLCLRSHVLIRHLLVCYLSQHLTKKNLRFSRSFACSGA